MSIPARVPARMAVKIPIGMPVPLTMRKAVNRSRPAAMKVE